MFRAVSEDEIRENKTFEIADIFRLYGQAYTKKHFVPLSHQRVMQAITDCRTEALGGYLHRCNNNDCDFEEILYASCGNRHCPKCQTMTKERWIENRKKELLPLPYYHMVFTLPHELNAIAITNKKVMYDILFKAVSQTLLLFGQDPKYLGGQTGFISILHTWNQTLLYHIHLHVIIPGCALSADKTKILYPKKKKILHPVKALSKTFRRLFMEGFVKASERKEIIFQGSLQHLNDSKAFEQYVWKLKKSKWVVFSKKTFERTKDVLEYLGRYTHKIAISNYRIRLIKDGFVTFTYQDRRDGNSKKECTLSAEEFIRRFLLHVLPVNYYRIRHFGFLSNRHRSMHIAICRNLLGMSEQAKTKSNLNAVELLHEITGVDPSICPKCKKGHMLFVRKINRVNYLRKKREMKISFLDSS